MQHVEVSTLLADGDDAIAHLMPLLEGESLTTWVALITDDRPAFLRRLMHLGVSSLSERQQVANHLARAIKRGQVADTGHSRTAMVTASEALKAAEAGVAHIRKQLADLEPSVRATRLEALGLPERFYDECVTLHDISPVRLIRALEATNNNLPPAITRVLPHALKYAGYRIGFYVAFGAASTSWRAAEVAAFDYADYGETLLGFTSYIVLNAAACVPLHLIEPLRSRFGERVIELGGKQLEDSYELLSRHGLSHLYVYKYGHAGCPPVSQLMAAAAAVAAGPHLKLLVHAAFDSRMPHGDRYARVSQCVQGSAPVVPHVVRPRVVDGDDMRAELGVPPDAKVFGRHGGLCSFDVPAARQAVLTVASEQPTSVYFIFVQTAALVGGDDGGNGGSSAPANIIHLPALSNHAELSRFIRTCDAMIHARADGETFGLAVCMCIMSRMSCT